jgi:uncharacterized protein YbjT (DUF2867 family)
VAVPRASDTVASFADVALGSGARRLVLLSGRGEEEAQACEKVLADSGADWTVVRSSWFNQNFSEGYLLDPILGGEPALPSETSASPSPTSTTSPRSRPRSSPRTDTSARSTS